MFEKSFVPAKCIYLNERFIIKLLGHVSRQVPHVAPCHSPSIMGRVISAATVSSVCCLLCAGYQPLCILKSSVSRDMSPSLVTDGRTKYF